MAKANPFVRSWKYFGAWFGAKVDERADPKIQIGQAIEEAQREHEALTRQAANVIGNQRQLEMKLDRQLTTVENLKAQARQALVLSEQAKAEGDAAKGAQFEQTAGTLASQLVTAEQGIQDLKQMHDQALGAAQQAREAVQNNEMILEQKLSERTKLLSQLEQAKMQEQVAASLNQISQIAAPKNTPSLDEVRDKIEARYATALGQADLASGSTQGRILEVQKATRDMAGASRLEEIRATLHPAPAPTHSVTAGEALKAVEQTPQATADPAASGLPEPTATPAPAEAQPQQSPPPAVPPAQ
ncbi:MAG: PspA/IM30 family protein [Jatrophihabitans sp.]